MRPHKLTISGFLAYGGIAEIDFDKLYESGLFLVYGETGAGKTSIFDAMAYALYGKVPGSRSADKNETYRSLHAAPDTPTYVELDATVGGKRLLIRRNPEYTRPKKKGEGVAKESAKTQVMVWKNNEWQPLESQHGGAEAEIQNWIRLKPDQFFKLVLLPQGDFAAFLKSKGKERSEILMNLFDVKTYLGIQTWFKDQAAELNKLVKDAEIEIGKVISKISQVIQDDSVNYSNTDDLNSVKEAFANVIPTLEQEVTSLKTASDNANDAFLLAEEKKKEQKQLLDAREAKNESEKKWGLLRGGIGDLVPAKTPDNKVKELVGAKRDIVYGELKTLESRVQDIDTLETRRRKLEKDREALNSSQTEVLENESKINLKKAELPALESSRQKMSDAASNFEKAKSELAKTKDLTDFFTKIDEAQSKIAAIQTRLDAARIAESSADEELSNAYKTQIALQASELAKALLPGQACPVCGSVDHPAPKTPDQDIERPDIPKIEKKRNAAQANRANIESELTEPQAELIAAQKAIQESGIKSIEEVGSMIKSKQDAVDQASGALSDAQKAQKTFEAITSEIGVLENKVATKKGQIGELEKTIPETETEIAELEEILKIKTGEIVTKPDLSVLEGELGKLDSLSAEIDSHLNDLIAKSAVLEKLEKNFSGNLEEIIDLEVLKENKETSYQEWSTKNQELVDTKAKVSDLTKLERELKKEETNLKGRKDALDRHLKISMYMTGDKSPRVPLINYYLSAKLQQVLQQANVRLREITSNRYTLYNKPNKEGRGQQSLSVEVHDSWNGERRSTDSLSGGEMFVCSLALALGLADSTNQGAMLESLFIDEGFGTLDQNYLNNVMDSLDRLRSSQGRLVGLVSHVTELRSRIPTRVYVKKGERSGSTIVSEY